MIHPGISQCIAANNRRRGSILIIVLVTIVILSLSAYTFTALMQTEEEAARLMTRRVQSKYLVESGVDFARLFLTNNEESLREKGGIWDNPNLQNIVVAVDPNRPERIGRFTIISSNLDDEGIPDGFRYGLMDESTKLNLNTLPYADAFAEGNARGLLSYLPNMTDEIADAIIDWIDPDDDVRDYGAESSFYNSQSPPYDCKNGPMDSLEELLLIRDITPQLLYGVDSNRNGIVDPEELTDPNASSMENDMLLGWANYLTLYSQESNLTPQFLQRININSPDLEQLYDDLRSVFDEDWARFIINYRIYGPQPPPGDNEEAFSAAVREIDFDLPATTNFESVLDLVDSYTNALEADDELNPPIIESPIKSTNKGFTIPIVMENLTTNSAATIPGRINVMQAPARVMAGIPGMTPELLERILELREFELSDPEGTDRNRKYETFLFVEDTFGVDLATMKQMFPYVCAGGDVFRAEIVGYFDDGVATSRCEAVIDTTVPIPRLLFWRDKSQLQAGYSIDVLGVDLSQ